MKKFSIILVSAILLSVFAFAQTTVAPVKTLNVKATLKAPNRKIIDPNVGIVRAPIPPANEHYKKTQTQSNTTTVTAPAQSTAPVKASTPLPVITSAQSKMNRAMTTPGSAKSAVKTTPSKYKGKKISGVKPGPKITNSSPVKAKPKTLKPAVKRPLTDREKMYNSIYHH